MPRRAKKVRDLLTLDDLDKRTQAAVHARDLMGRIVADKGGEAMLTALELKQIENAAMTSAILSSLQCRWMAREAPSETERLAVPMILTAQNTFNRLVEQVGAGRVAKDVTTVREELIEEARQRRTASATDAESEDV